MRKLLRHDQAIVTNEGPSRRLDTLLAVFRQRDVGSTCMSAIQRPLRLAVADDEDSGC